MQSFFGKYITLYRPTYVEGISDSGCIKEGVGDLRAKFFGVRVPIFWALNCMASAKRLVYPIEKPELSQYQ